MKYKKISQILRKLRVDAGLSQMEVAQVFDYATPQFISNWERGLSYPPISSILELARLYGVSPESIFNTLMQDVLEDLERSMREKYEALAKNK